MQKTVFWSYIFIICLVTGLIGLYSIKISHHYHIQEFQDYVIKEGNMISKYLNMIYDIETEDVTKIDNFIKQTANDLELCITIIDKNGNVISSSEKNLYDINQKNMPEVQSALKGETIKIIRKNLFFIGSIKCEGREKEMEIDYLENYYNNYEEDTRLQSRHGQIEFITSMKYIEQYLEKGAKILDVGAGTGRYSLALSRKGYNVTAV